MKNNLNVYYWVVIKDLKNKEFTIMGPVSDDTDYTNKVEKKNENGCDMNMELIETSEKDKEEVICDYKDSGYSYTSDINI